jgi:hypothetical protein
VKAKFIFAFLASIIFITFANAIFFPVTNCGQINSSGYYYLANNISNSTEKCFDLSSISNVTFEGRGNIIKDASYAFWIATDGSNNVSNIFINNVTTVGATNFIDAEGGGNYDFISNLQISNIKIKDLDPLGYGFNILYADNVGISNVTFINSSVTSLVISDFTNMAVKNISFVGYVGLRIEGTTYNYGYTGQIANMSWENDFGKVNFYNIPLQGKESGGIITSDYAQMTNNFVSYDDSVMNFSGISANIKLYGLTFSNPRILKNGALCSGSVCTNFVYASGIASFDVNEFSNYSLEETPSQTITGFAGLSDNLGSAGSGISGFLGAIFNAKFLSIILVFVVAIVVMIIGFGIVKMIDYLMAKLVSVI